MEVSIDGRARAGDYLGKGSGWRDLDEVESDAMFAAMDAMQ